MNSDMSLGKWISLLYRYGHIYITKELEQYDIGKGQFLFLIALYQKDGMSQDEIASFLHIDKGTTARALKKLELNGYIERKSNDQDLRSNFIFLTHKAMAFKPNLRSSLQGWTDILSAGLTDEELEMAFTLFRKMAKNAADYVHNERA
ncbi:hypothetical protein BHU72_13475 [Desulfuribacillus stibiiarsenatis]|uniref:HTH marR-type domain-containing protein n=1 Tax=Desulfuribacillus stibiiarsenatis TaxID=1390249 RepID=A0A1E5L903_9FIRM|nr:MarR family transcriptional regulator [Desulfuribacillus stibiiarsenatis]OEH86423.1 hypothetical protein BHU72_13475 [Desulfuribacillus stibiiarsenatis]